MRKSRNSIDLLRYFATNPAISSRPSNSFNNAFVSIYFIFRIFNISPALSKRSALICLNVSHFVKKWISSSTDVQKGQILISLSKLRCLPFSIFNLWLDNRNFVIDTRSPTFLTILRYGSSPAPLLIRP